jgi:hypothetical protein
MDRDIRNAKNGIVTTTQNTETGIVGKKQKAESRKRDNRDRVINVTERVKIPSPH